MDLQISLKTILKHGALRDELDFQRASVIDRQLRILVKEHPELAEDRKELRRIIKAYEDEHWVNDGVTDLQVEQSDLAERIAEQERVFLEKRKLAIKSKLKALNLTQKDLGTILGHSSATYMSELVSGVNPFTLNDLIIINRLLDIDLSTLIPTTLNGELRNRVKQNILKLNNPKLKLGMDDLVEV